MLNLSEQRQEELINLLSELINFIKENKRKDRFAILEYISLTLRVFTS